MTEQSPDKTAKYVWKFKASTANFVALGVAGLFLLVSLLTNGFGGLIIMAGFVGIVTALYVVVTGRQSWASIPSRKVAAITIAASVVMFAIGGAVSGPSNVDSESTSSRSGSVSTAKPAVPTQSTKPEKVAEVAFTDGDPGEPLLVTGSSDAASVVIADNSVTDSTAIALLATIPIKGKAPKTGYDRTADFGSAWLDVDHNGCDTRNDILARDLLTSVKSGSCTVASGSFVEPYTDTTINFVRGNTTSSLVQIDHLVALSNAWQTGAQQLTQAQRISLANDPINLLAVDGRSNSQKGDGDAATWLPANKAFRCTYIARQVSVKATYGLWVAQAEHDAMLRVLSDCPDARALTSAFAPAKVVAPAPAPVVKAPVVKPPVVAPAPAAPAPAPAAPAPAAPATFYQNCDAVRAAGAAPIHRGDAGYSSKLDRDGDGVGCE